jgi:hypothetical protein
MVNAFRAADWFNSARAAGYGKAILLLMVLTFVPYYLAGIGLVRPGGQVIGSDFLNFWSAGRAVLAGDPAGAYSEDVLRRLQAEAIPGSPLYHYMYAPPFLAFFAALALFPYEIALLVWLAMTLPLYLLTATRLLPVEGSIWPIAAFPAVLLVAGHGQTGFVVFAVFALGLILLPHRPFAAGMTLGLLLMKPHFALLLPLAMLASRKWKAVAGGALSVSALLALGLLAFGTETYKAYLVVFGVSGRVLEGGVPYYTMVSSYAAVRSAGGSAEVAAAVQVGMAGVAAVLVWIVWRRDNDILAKGSVLVVCTLLTTPYAYDYDLILLMLPIAWLIMTGLKFGFRPWEKSLIALCWWLPLGARAIGKASSYNVAPLVIVVCLLLVLTRVEMTTVGRRQPA